MNAAIQYAYVKLAKKGFKNISFYKMRRDYFTFDAIKDGDSCTVFVNISNQEISEVKY